MGRMELTKASRPRLNVALLEKVLLRHCASKDIPEIKLFVAVMAKAAFDHDERFIDGRNGPLWAQWCGLPVGYMQECCHKLYPHKLVVVQFQ